MSTPTAPASSAPTPFVQKFTKHRKNTEFPVIALEPGTQNVRHRFASQYDAKDFIVANKLVKENTPAKSINRFIKECCAGSRSTIYGFAWQFDGKPPDEEPAAPVAFRNPSGEVLWRDIDPSNLHGTTDYKVSSAGMVRLPTGKETNGNLDTRTGHLRLRVGTRFYSVSRLVAQTFVPNPNGYALVNFVNGDKTDCRAENIIWTNKRPQNFATNKNRVVCVFVDGSEKVYTSMRDAETQTGVNQMRIAKSIREDTRLPDGLKFRKLAA